VNGGNLLDQVAAISVDNLPKNNAFKKLELGNAMYSGYISGIIPERRSIIDQ